MRFLSIVMVVAMVTTVGCGDDTSSNNNNNGTDVVTGTDTGAATDSGPAPDSSSNCSADCNGALANNPQGLCSIYDAKYASGNVTCDASTCTANTSGCTEANVGPAAGEFEPCTGNCEEGLTCVEWTTTSSYCLKPCASEEDTSCGQNACSGIADQDGDGEIDTFLCLKKDAMVNGSCLENLSLCADGQGECQWTDLVDGPQGPTPAGFRCKINCESAADCGANACLPNPVGKVSVEQGQGPGGTVACTDDSACSEGYECINLTNGMACASIVSWCGTESLACGEEMTQDGLGVCIADPANDCSMSGSGLCSVVGAAGDEADVLCVPVDDTKSICIGFCGGEDGNQTLDCGAGYQCIRPADSGVLLPETQKDAMGNPISCTLGDDTPCDAAGEYKCVTGQNDAPVCGRAFKLCQKL